MIENVYVEIIKVYNHNRFRWHIELFKHFKENKIIETFAIKPISNRELS